MVSQVAEETQDPEIILLRDFKASNGWLTRWKTRNMRVGYIYFSFLHDEIDIITLSLILMQKTVSKKTKIKISRTNFSKGGKGETD